MSKRYYYGSQDNFASTLPDETEVFVEINTKRNKYTATFAGADAIKQAIAYMASISAITGKDTIYELRVNTNLYQNEDAPE